MMVYDDGDNDGDDDDDEDEDEDGDNDGKIGAFVRTLWEAL